MKEGMTASALRSQYAAETANGAGYLWSGSVQTLKAGKAKKSGGSKAVLALLLALLLTLVGSAVFFLLITRDTPAETTLTQSEKPAGKDNKKDKEEEEELPARKDLFDDNGVQIGYFTYDYDEEGRCIRQEELSMDGVSKRLWEFTYSADGRECETLFYWNGEYTLRIVEYYNEAGILTEEHSYNTNDALTGITYCDAEGNYIRRETYQGAAGAEWKWVEEELNEHGYATKRYYFTESGERDSTSMSEYDEQGNEIRNVYYNGEGEFLWDTRYEYDENGNCIRQEEYNENGELMEYIIREYRPDGQIQREAWYDAEGNLERYTVTEYSEDGRPIAEQDYDADDVQTGYSEYVYAEDGSYDLVSYRVDGTERYRMSFDANGVYIG